MLEEPEIPPEPEEPEREPNQEPEREAEAKLDVLYCGDRPGLEPERD